MTDTEGDELPWAPPLNPYSELIFMNNKYQKFFYHNTTLNETPDQNRVLASTLI
jgi:hypothetical protein